MSENPPIRRDRRVAALLVLLPLWLVVSSLLGLYLWWKGEQARVDGEPAKFATPVEASRLADDMRKMVAVVGERHVQSETGVSGLKRAAAMIEGSLGASNAGYRLKTVRGPTIGSDALPLIVATLPGNDAPVLWVVAGYDSAPGSPGAEANASGVASVVAVAEALAGADVGRPVSFAFLPHVQDADGPVLETLQQFADLAEGADLVLVVESMGAGDALKFSSRDATAVTRSAFTAHGSVVGAEAICLEDDRDLSSLLFELGLPAVRVSTRAVVRADEADVDLPDPETHAAATGRLAALVRDLGASR